MIVRLIKWIDDHVSSLRQQIIFSALIYAVLAAPLCNAAGFTGALGKAEYCAPFPRIRWLSRCVLKRRSNGQWICLTRSGRRIGRYS
jgi:hypothetical protein